jgi:hypothetical protein
MPIPDEPRLLRRRMAMLGLDPYVTECGETQIFHEIERRCAECDVRKVCANDLKHRPHDAVWESYCPNAGVFNKLSDAWWLPH